MRQDFVLLCERKSTGCLVLILLLAGIAGALYTANLGNSLRYWDEEHYLLLAQNLHKGIYSFNGQDPTAFQPPGYPFFLYFWSFVSHDLSFLRFLNFICLAISIGLLFSLLKKYAGRLAAVIGACLAAIYPLFFYTASTFYPQTLAAALLLLFFYIALIKPPRGPAGEVGIGLIVGSLLLVVPSFLSFLPLFLLYPWFTKNADRLRASCCLLLGCAAVVSCWTIRNALTFDRYVLISTNSGVNLLLGNAETTKFDSGVNTNLDRYLKRAGQMDEFERDKYFQEEALAWIQSHPKKALKLYALKVLNYFNYTNNFASKAEKTAARDFLSFVFYYPLLLLAAARLLFIKKHPLHRAEWLLLACLFIAPFLQAIFFTRIRFRLPFDFLMIYFAACTLSFLLKKGRVESDSPSMEQTTPSQPSIVQKDL